MQTSSTISFCDICQVVVGISVLYVHEMWTIPFAEVSFQSIILALKSPNHHLKQFSVHSPVWTSEISINCQMCRHPDFFLKYAVSCKEVLIQMLPLHQAIIRKEVWMCLQTTVSSFQKFFFFLCSWIFKNLASLLMHVSADNRMLRQIENSKQNGWVLLQMGGDCLNRQYFEY